MRFDRRSNGESQRSGGLTNTRYFKFFDKPSVNTYRITYSRIIYPDHRGHFSTCKSAAFASLYGQSYINGTGDRIIVKSLNRLNSRRNRRGELTLWKFGWEKLVSRYAFHLPSSIRTMQKLLINTQPSQTNSIDAVNADNIISRTIPTYLIYIFDY